MGMATAAPLYNDRPPARLAVMSVVSVPVDALRSERNEAIDLNKLNKKRLVRSFVRAASKDMQLHPQHS